MTASNESTNSGQAGSSTGRFNSPPGKVTIVSGGRGGSRIFVSCNPKAQQIAKMAEAANKKK